jgi:hypothetical protein
VPTEDVYPHLLNGQRSLGKRQVLRLGGREKIKAQYVGQFVQLLRLVFVIPRFGSIGDEVVFGEFIGISPYLLDIILPNVLITQQGIE